MCCQVWNGWLNNESSHFWVNYGWKSFKFICKKNQKITLKRSTNLLESLLFMLAGLCLSVEMKTDYSAQVWLIRSHIASSQCLWAVRPQRRAVFHCEIKRSCATQTTSLCPVRPGRFAAECFAQLLLIWGWKRGMHNLTHGSFSSLRENDVKSSTLSVIVLNCPVMKLSVQ